MTPLTSHTGSARAFTLLELLVATAIFSVLIGAIYSVLWSGMALREKAWEQLDGLSQRDHMAMLIRRDLRNTVVPSGVLAGAIIGETGQSGTTRVDLLTFFSTSGAVADSAPWGDIQQIEYFLAPPLEATANGGMDFVRRIRRDLLATTIEQEDVPGRRWRLLNDVGSMQIQYFDGEQWLDSWDSTAVENENPIAVHLYLELMQAPDEPLRRPIDILVEIAPQPRSTPVSTNAGGGGAGSESPPQASEGGPGGAR